MSELQEERITVVISGLQDETVKFQINKNSVKVISKQSDLELLCTILHTLTTKNDIEKALGAISQLNTRISSFQ